MSVAKEIDEGSLLDATVTVRVGGKVAFYYGGGSEGSSWPPHHCKPVRDCLVAALLSNDRMCGPRAQTAQAADQ